MPIVRKIFDKDDSSSEDTDESEPKKVSPPKKVKKTIDTPKSKRGRKPKATKILPVQTEESPKAESSVKLELLADWGEDDGEAIDTDESSGKVTVARPKIIENLGSPRQKPSLTASGTIIKYRNIPKKNIREFVLEDENDKEEATNSIQSKEIMNVSSDKLMDNTSPNTTPVPVSKPISAKERILNRVSLRRNSLEQNTIPVEAESPSSTVKETEIVHSPKNKSPEKESVTLENLPSNSEPEEEQEKADKIIEDILLTPVIESTPEKKTSCFDFDDDEDINDVHLTKKSPKTTALKNSAKENDDIKSKIDMFLQEASVPEISVNLSKTPANNAITSPENFDAKERKLPPKERGKRIFKSRNRSSLEIPAQKEFSELEPLSKKSEIAVTTVTSQPSESDLQIAETLINLPEAGMRRNVPLIQIDAPVNPRKRHISNDVNDSNPKQIKHVKEENELVEEAITIEDKPLTEINTEKVAEKSNIEETLISNDTVEENNKPEEAAEKEIKQLENETNVFDIDNMEILISYDPVQENVETLPPLVENKPKINEEPKLVKKMTIISKKEKFIPRITKKIITSKRPIITVTEDDLKAMDDSPDVISNPLVERIPKYIDRNIKSIPMKQIIKTKSIVLNEGTSSSSSKASRVSPSLIIKRKVNADNSSEDTDNMKTKKIIIQNSNGISTLVPIKSLSGSIQPIKKTSKVVKNNSVGQILITSKGDVITTQSQPTVSSASNTLTSTTSSSESSLITSIIPLKTTMSKIGKGQLDGTTRVTPKIEVQSQKIICPATKVIDNKKGTANNKLTNENVVISEHMILKKSEPQRALSSLSPKILKCASPTSSPTRSASTKKTSVVIIPASEMEELERRGYVRKNENGEAVATKDYKKFRAEKDKLAEQSVEKSPPIVIASPTPEIVCDNTEIISSNEHIIDNPVAIESISSLPAPEKEIKTDLPVMDTKEIINNFILNPKPEIQREQKNHIVPVSSFTSSSMEIQPSTSASAIQEAAQILAVPADNFGGPVNSFYLCQVCDDGNLQPIDSQPLYLDSTNQLVPLSQNPDIDTTTNVFQHQLNEENNVVHIDSLTQPQQHTGNDSIIINTGDGQQIILDQQSLLALAGSSAGTGGEMPQFITADGQQIVLQGSAQELLTALALNGTELNLEGLNEDQVSSQDILATALANTQMYHLNQSKALADVAVNNIMYHHPANVSETNAVLTQPPIMSAVEAPSHNNNLNINHGDINNSLMENNLNLDDTLAAIGVTSSQTNVPTSLELPITVTNPVIAAKISNPLPLSTIYPKIAAGTTSTSVTAAVLAAASLASTPQPNLNYIFNTHDAGAITSSEYIEHKIDEEISENNIIFCNTSNEIEILDNNSVDGR